MKIESFNDLLILIWKRRTLTLCIFLIVVIIVTVLNLMQPSVYEARGKLEVMTERQYSSLFANVTALKKETELKSEVESVRSRKVLRKAILRVRIHDIEQTARRRGEEPPQEIPPLTDSELNLIIQELKERLRVEPVEKSDIILVSVEDTDPARAAMFVNEIMAISIEMRSQYDEQESNQTYQFFDRQIKDATQNLRQAEDALDQFQKEHDLVDLEEQRRLALETVAHTSRELSQARSDMAGSKAEMEHLRRELSEQDEEILEARELHYNPMIKEIKIKLIDLEVQYNHLVQKYTPGHRELLNLEKEIARLREALAQESSTVVGLEKRAINRVYQSLSEDLALAESRYRSLNAQAGVLEREMALGQQLVQQIDSWTKILNRLRRNVGTAEDLYDIYVRKMEEARIAEERDRIGMALVRIVDEAGIPTESIRPRRMMNIILGILAGFFLGTAAALLAETWQSLRQQQSG